MSLHKNARLTLHCRELLINRLLGGESRVQVGRRFGISVRTVDKWLERFRQEGPSGLRIAPADRCASSPWRSWRCAVSA
jgi:transposase